jgi:hypothetical protein
MDVRFTAQSSQPDEQVGDQASHRIDLDADGLSLEQARCGDDDAPFSGAQIDHFLSWLHVG